MFALGSGMTIDLFIDRPALFTHQSQNATFTFLQLRKYEKAPGSGMTIDLFIDFRRDRSLNFDVRQNLCRLAFFDNFTNALRALFKSAMDRSPDSLRLANALSALYPRGSEEKRLLDAMLLAVPR